MVNLENADILVYVSECERVHSRSAYHILYLAVMSLGEIGESVFRKA